MKSYVKPPNKLQCFEYYPYEDNDDEKNKDFLRQEKLNNLKKQLPTYAEVMEERILKESRY
jgi:hypothetical protein